MSSLSVTDRFQQDLPDSLRQQFAKFGIRGEGELQKRDSFDSSVLTKVVIKCEKLFTTIRFEYFRNDRGSVYSFFKGFECRYKDGGAVVNRINCDGLYLPNEALQNIEGMILDSLRAIRGDSALGSVTLQGGPSLTRATSIS